MSSGVAYTPDADRFVGNDATVRTHVHQVAGGAIFEIQINRPEMHNSVNGPTAALLLEAWSRFRDDDRLTVAILHGAGDRAFCSGADLTALEELVNPNATPAEIEAAVQSGTGPMGGSRILQRKPVITVTHGYTYAGGLELYCHGHIRIAEKQALFSVACRRWGVPLVDGGTVYLPRLLGQAQALPMILTGQRIRAQRAYEIGLVWELTSKGRGLARAFRVGEQLCVQPRDAMLADLNSAVDGAHLSMEAALRLEARNIYPVAKSDSFREGVARFNRGERFWFI